MLFALDIVFLYKSVRVEPSTSSVITSGDIPSVYIASIRADTTFVDPVAWANDVKRLVSRIGINRTFVSVQDKSCDKASIDSLWSLSDDLLRLDVKHSIVDHCASYRTDFDLTWAAQGMPVPSAANMSRKIPQLAHLRNLALRPMIYLALQGVRFDRLLFLEDVYFTVGTGLAFNLM